MSTQSDWLPFESSVEETAPAVFLPDAAARARAVDPTQNVVLEASAGTGKTHVLVERYLNLLGAGVEPANILAITFTRKAAAEMRGRILAELRRRAESSEDRELWRAVRERSGDVTISTIDAFCLSLLHEFPLEANLDPGFEMADETQVPRLMEEALDRALDVARGLARKDEYLRLLFAELRESRLREGLATMINRRLVVEDALARALELGPRDLTPVRACDHAFVRLRAAFAGLNDGLDRFLLNGPVRHRRFQLLMDDMRTVANGAHISTGVARGILERVEDHFLVERRRPRQRFANSYVQADCDSKLTWKAHLDGIQTIGGDVAAALKAFRRDLNAVLSRGVHRLFGIALHEYYKTLDAHGVLDFSETLARSLQLLAQMEEFARSRYRLEGRYHHVLLDEFQDTSRAQWLLVALLVRSWGEGRGVGEESPLVPSIFLVGDRKQSIYGFRDADAGVMEDAAGLVDSLRPDRDSRRAISTSFRAVPALLSFANDMFDEIEKDPSRRDAFRFNADDRFPVPEVPAPAAAADSLGIIAAPTVAACADIVAGEIERLITDRGMSPRDIGILFRTKDSHKEFEKALARRHIASYVYKGLGFFEADEIKDVLALLRYLALPESDLRAAAFMRSRFVRLSDATVQQLAPNLAAALAGRAFVDVKGRNLEEADRLLVEKTRSSIGRWLNLVDRLPPAEILDLIINETAYVFETRGPRERQARENLKKIRSMIRRLQNRGYITMSRLAEHLDRLTAGDESNAVIDAGDAVSLMTVHAAKGLEFPAVFVVNLSRGTVGRRLPIRVVSDPDGGRAWLSVSDFQSEADEDAKAREKEETKRLLYVAITRAKERLYLASEVKEGKWRAWSGGLGEVLPESLRPKFEAAAHASAPDHIDWTASSGQSHRLRVCKLTESAPILKAAAQPPSSGDFVPLSDVNASPRRPVTSPSRATPHTADRGLAGRLVHRLFERHGTALGTASVEAAALKREAARLIRDVELPDVVDLDQLLERAAGAYASLCADADVSRALASGLPMFEVPFSVRTSGAQQILRGSFDCLVRRADGGVTILELKTGTPLPEHDEQLQTYLTAARALFPGTAVEGKLVYAGQSHLDDRSLDADR